MVMYTVRYIYKLQKHFCRNSGCTDKFQRLTTNVLKPDDHHFWYRNLFFGGEESNNKCCGSGSSQIRNFLFDSKLQVIFDGAEKLNNTKDSTKLENLNVFKLLLYIFKFQCKKVFKFHFSELSKGSDPKPYHFLDTHYRY